MAAHGKIWNAITSLRQTQDKQAKQILRLTTVNLRLRVSDLEDTVEKLQMQVADATEGNTIDRDMGAKNEMGEEAG